MKYLSLLFLVFLMAWTFDLSYSKRDIPIEVHGLLVKELKQVMTEYLTTNVEGVRNIVFYRVYTESVVSGKRLKAFVKYSYESPTKDGQMTKELREGEFDLVSPDNGQSWEPQALNFRDLNLEFMEELKITPNQERSTEKVEESEVEM